MSKRRGRMRVIDLGSAGPNHPIYTQGPVVWFKPEFPPAPIEDNSRATTNSTDTLPQKPENT